MLKSTLAAGGLAALLPVLGGAVAAVPDDMWWVPIVVPAITGVAVGAMHAASTIYAARKRARADARAEEAQRMLDDADPSNDIAARSLLLEAKADRAEADAVERLGNEAAARLKPKE